MSHEKITFVRKNYLNIYSYTSNGINILRQIIEIPVLIKTYNFSDSLHSFEELYLQQKKHDASKL